MTTVRQLLDQKGRKIWSIHPDATVFDAIAKMAEKDIGSFPPPKHFEEPSPESELALWELVPSEWVLAWVPQLGWGSSPECRWVPSRVDEHESRATFLIEQAGLPD